MSRRFVWIGTLAATGAVVLFLHTLLYSDSWSTRAQVRTDLASLTHDNDVAEQRIESLRRQIAAMRARPEVQERAVRHELGYLRPGEIVLDLSDAR